MKACRSISGLGCAQLGSALALLAILIAARTQASSLAAGGGAEYFDGPEGQLTRTAYALVGAGDARWSGALTLAAFSDAFAGHGDGVIGALGAPLGNGVGLRAWAARFVGERDFRAWRLKAGPRWSLGDDRDLGVYAAHWEETGASASNGVVAEFGTPVAQRLRGRINGTWATLPDQPQAMQGGAGVDWNPVTPFTLSADLGVARRGAFVGEGSPGGPGHHLLDQLPILGGGPPGSPSEPAAAPNTGIAFTLGARVVFP